MLLTGIGIGYLIAMGSSIWKLTQEFHNVRDDMDAIISQRPKTEAAGLKVRILAKQYSWHFQYPGPDGEFGSSDSRKKSSTVNPLGIDFDDPAAQDDLYSNELVLPCGIDAGVFLISADVIHAVGQLEGAYQADADPGGYNATMLKTPTTPRAGTFRCVQLCGPGHQQHHAAYRFVEQAEFNHWLAGLVPIVATRNSPPTGLSPAGDKSE